MPWAAKRRLPGPSWRAAAILSCRPKTISPPYTPRFKRPSLLRELPPPSSHRADTTENSDHGRHERRTVQVLPAAGYLSKSLVAAWLGLLTLVMVVRVVTCQATGVTTTEVSYFISSLRPNARRIGKAIRGHWSIENGLHWVLDVVFREDARRLYDRTAAENTAFLNRLALSLLRGDPSKGSLKVKRKRAGRNIGYLAQLLGFPSI